MGRGGLGAGVLSYDGLAWFCGVRGWLCGKRDVHCWVFLALLALARDVDYTC